VLPHQIFIHARDWARLHSTHQNGRGSPQNCLQKFKFWPKIERVRPYNFATSGSSLTKLFQTTSSEGGVITGVPFFEGHPPEIWEGQKTSKFRRRFWQISSLIANISYTDPQIEYRKSTWSTTTPSTLDEKNVVNFGPQTKKLLMCILTHPSGHFSGDYISALRRCCALKFLHALEIDQGHLAQSPTGTGVPPQKNMIKNLKF